MGPNVCVDYLHVRTETTQQLHFVTLKRIPIISKFQSELIKSP